MDERELGELLPEYVLGTLDAAERVRLERAIARSPALREEAQVLAGVLYAMPEGYDSESVPEGAWERLRDAVREHRTTPTHRAAPPERPDEHVASARGSRRRSAFWGMHGMTVALLAALVLVLATGVWGVRTARQRAQLANEERIIAYWMRHADLRILPLQPVAAGAEPDEHLGVVCVLPDGRAMMLQPNDAPRGRRYVLYGNGVSGRVELGTTPHRFLLFDATGLVGVELTVQGRGEHTLGTVRF